MDKIAGIFAAAILVVVALFIFALIMSVPVWLLWNWVAVTVLGLKEITLLQALGLSLLSSFLLKSSSVSK